jgi:HlyD family secretion protein
MNNSIASKLGVEDLLRVIRPSGPATLRDDARPEIMLGAVIALVFFVGFLGWAALAPMDAAAYAAGQVTVAGHRQSVQHREGGVVQRLLVHEGQQVQKGQLLVELAGGDVLARESALSAQVWGLKATKARLLSEQLGLSSIAWPAEFSAATGEDRQEADEAMRIQERQFAARASCWPPKSKCFASGGCNWASRRRAIAANWRRAASRRPPCSRSSMRCGACRPRGSLP